jgi:hypothetical protein
MEAPPDPSAYEYSSMLDGNTSVAHASMNQTGRSSHAMCRWSAELRNFPEKLDVRPIVEFMCGEAIATRYMRFMFKHVKWFIGIGILIHVVGIGSISGLQTLA